MTIPGGGFARGRIAAAAEPEFGNVPSFSLLDGLGLVRMKNCTGWDFIS